SLAADAFDQSGGPVQLRVGHLQGDVATQKGIPGTPDDAVCSLADALDEPEARDHFADVVGRRRRHPKGAGTAGAMHVRGRARNVLDGDLTIGTAQAYT